MTPSCPPDSQTPTAPLAVGAPPGGRTPNPYKRETPESRRRYAQTIQKQTYVLKHVLVHVTTTTVPIPHLKVETQAEKQKNKHVTQTSQTNMSLPEIFTKLIKTGGRAFTCNMTFGKNHPKYKPIVCLCVIEEKHITIDFQDVLLKVKY